MADDYLAVIEQQYILPWEERRRLIPFEGSAVLNQQGVDFATAIARQYMLPVSCIALIATKQGLRPYVTSEGMLFRLHHDVRGPVTITTEVLDWGDVTKKARFRATVTIGGSTYTAFAQVSLDGKGDPDNNLMRADTKSVRRACMRAVGIPFPVYEEAREYADTAYDERPAYERRARQDDTSELDVAGPFNVVEFMAEADKLGFSSHHAILTALGVSAIEELAGDYRGALELLKEVSRG